MQGRSKILDVPYFTQSTGVTCQSTVLKMMASYLEQNVVLASTGSADRDILDIWKDINEDPHRPIKNAQNAHLNMKWWLEKHFSNLVFQYTPFTNEVLALEATSTW